MRRRTRGATHGEPHPNDRRADDHTHSDTGADLATDRPARAGRPSRASRPGGQGRQHRVRPPASRPVRRRHRGRGAGRRGPDPAGRDVPLDIAGRRRTGPVHPDVRHRHRAAHWRCTRRVRRSAACIAGDGRGRCDGSDRELGRLFTRQRAAVPVQRHGRFGGAPGRGRRPRTAGRPLPALGRPGRRGSADLPREPGRGRARPHAGLRSGPTPARLHPGGGHVPGAVRHRGRVPVPARPRPAGTAASDHAPARPRRQLRRRQRGPPRRAGPWTARTASFRNN